MNVEEVYARKHCVLTVRTGSNLYGTVVSTTPDHDEMGIFVEDEASLFSVDPKYTRPTSVTYRTAGTRADGTDAPSTGTDTDGQLYALSHFMRETARGNPNTMTILFAQGSAILNQTPKDITRSLRLHRERFISKAMGDRYLGYLKNQRRMYLADGAPAQRPDLVDKFGFDTKGAYHALRVAMQGYELLDNGTITLPMTEAQRGYLIRVRRGHFSKTEVISQLGELEDMLALKVMRNDWPLTPDYRLLTKWNRELHELYWAYQDSKDKWPF